MPYITKDRRDDFEQAIQLVVDTLASDDQAKGELNYVIFSIIKRYVTKHGIRYFRLQDFIGGVLTCCQHELLRRLVDPYEDRAITKNGDV